MFSAKISLFFLLILITILNLSYALNYPSKHKCQYHKHRTPKLSFHTFKKHHTQEVSTNSLYGPLRILIDYSNLNVTKSIYSKIKKDIFTDVVFVLNKYFQINRTIDLIRFHSVYCSDVKIPLFHKTFGVRNVDLVLYITAINDEFDGSVAWASSCFVDEENDRPIAAQVNLNLFYLKNATYSVVKNTITHELLHVLGFDNELFGKFQYENGTKIPRNQIINRSEPNNYIIIPEIVNMSRNYFGCETMQGAPLEKGLGLGSDNCHWAEEYFEHDLMTPYQGLNQVISNFTLAFFNHTGWYRMNYNNRSKMTWGKNKGCSFVDNQCYGQKSTYGEFCSNLGQRGCSPDNRFISTCWNSYSRTHCPVNYETRVCSIPSKKYNQTEYEFFGDVQTSGSKCMYTDITNGIFYDNYANCKNDPGHKCIQADCFIKDNGKQAINISFYNFTMVCNKSEVWISPSAETGYKGILYCPNIKKFCEVFPEDCKSGCNGNGLCINGICDCFDFIKGEDCNNYGRKFKFSGTGLATTTTKYKSQYFS